MISPNSQLFNFTFIFLQVTGTSGSLSVKTIGINAVKHGLTLN